MSDVVFFRQKTGVSNDRYLPTMNDAVAVSKSGNSFTISWYWQDDAIRRKWVENNSQQQAVGDLRFSLRHLELFHNLYVDLKRSGQI